MKRRDSDSVTPSTTRDSASSPRRRFGLRSEYDVPDNVFMAMELKPGALQGRGPGTIRYHAAFESV